MNEHGDKKREHTDAVIKFMRYLRYYGEDTPDEIIRITSETLGLDEELVRGIYNITM